MPKSFLVKTKKQPEFERKFSPTALERSLPTGPDDQGTTGWLVTSLPSNESPLSPPALTAAPIQQLFKHCPLTSRVDGGELLGITSFHRTGKARFDFNEEIPRNTSHIFQESGLTEQTLLQYSLNSNPTNYLCNGNSNTSSFYDAVFQPEMLRFPTAEGSMSHEAIPTPTTSGSEKLTNDFRVMDCGENGGSGPGSPCKSPSSVSMVSITDSEASTSDSVLTPAVHCVSRRTPSTDSRKYRYACDVCGKTFSRSNTLTTHKRIHTGDKPFKCEECGRAFRQPGNLTRHRLTHTTIKPYVCTQCNKAFNRASNLHTHMRTHTNYKPFVCDFCGKGFHQKIDMKIHRYTHTGEKPHKCQKCGRGFKQLTHLTYHMRTHSDVRMYKCEYCGKGFNQKGNLQAHIYGHTGQRPYKCDVCGKGFTLASTLNTHKRTHAPKKPFQCKLCQKAFYQKNALKTHYIASHPFANGVSLL